MLTTNEQVTAEGIKVSYCTLRRLLEPRIELLCLDPPRHREKPRCHFQLAGPPARRREYTSEMRQTRI